MTEPANESYFGPDPDLSDRISVATLAPPVPGESFDDQLVRHARLVAAPSYAALSAEDRAWLDARVGEVNAGLSNLIMDPNLTGADWAAEDAAEDAEDPPPVATAPGGDVGDVSEVKELGPDDDGWVG